MNAYTVVWDRELVAELTQLWVTSSSQMRRFLTRATDEIDEILKR